MTFLKIVRLSPILQENLRTAKQSKTYKNKWESGLVRKELKYETRILARITCFKSAPNKISNRVRNRKLRNNTTV